VQLQSEYSCLLRFEHLARLRALQSELRSQRHGRGQKSMSSGKKLTEDAGEVTQPDAGKRSAAAGFDSQLQLDSAAQNLKQLLPRSGGRALGGHSSIIPLRPDPIGPGAKQHSVAWIRAPPSPAPSARTQLRSMRDRLCAQNAF